VNQNPQIQSLEPTFAYPYRRKLIFQLFSKRVLVITCDLAAYYRISSCAQSSLLKKKALCKSRTHARRLYHLIWLYFPKWNQSPKRNKRIITVRKECKEFLRGIGKEVRKRKERKVVVSKGSVHTMICFISTLANASTAATKILRCVKQFLLEFNYM
jgi:hypothetical protein